MYRPESGYDAASGSYLPEGRRERLAWLALAFVVLVLKALAIVHYRADSDESQHAHVVWAISHGQLPYRDFFDNHMPLFHLALAPFFGLLGEHASILIMLRVGMLPLLVLCLWCVFTLTERLFDPRLAPWAALFAAALPPFFYTSTEFRPDLAWAAVWLLGLVIALCGRFTLRRAFVFGLLLGVDLALSIKTPFLWAALAVSAVIAFGLNAWRGGPRFQWQRALGYLFTIGVGALIVPAGVVLYFTWKGAFWIMYYCVIRHNMMPGLKRWGHLSLFRWIFPASLPGLAGLAVLTYRQATDHRLAVRRVILLLTPCATAALLYSYCPDVTRQDCLPYAPLTPLLVIPLMGWLKPGLRFPALQARLYTRVLPAVCLMELVVAWNFHFLRKNRLRDTSDSIRDVLLLTKPDQYVMDAESGYIFRPRPDYWVFETVTRARIRAGLIHDHLEEDLVRTGAPICFFYTCHVLPAATRFIMENYLPFDPAALDLGALGKELGRPAADGSFSFDVWIPGSYAVVSENGETAGSLDGSPYLGPLRLEAGHHVFRRTSGSGRGAILLATASAAGFHPLFDVSEKMIREEEAGK